MKLPLGLITFVVGVVLLGPLFTGALRYDSALSIARLALGLGFFGFGLIRYLRSRDAANENGAELSASAHSQPNPPNRVRPFFVLACAAIVATMICGVLMVVFHDRLGVSGGVTGVPLGLGILLAAVFIVIDAIWDDS